MREIKFRAWGKSKKTMYYQDFAVNPDGTTKTWGLYEHLELLQYTGLHDKRGKEIYEGDILRFPDGEVTNVIWMEYPAAFSPMDLHLASEVIGNIYENPELVNQGGE